MGRARNLRSIIVGMDKASGEVCRICVQVDGLMISGATMHFPSEGRGTFLEALRVFNLMNAREFPADRLEEAAIYAETLMG